MNNGLQFIKENIADQDAAAAFMGRLYDVAQSASVFTAAVQHGEYAVITASEVTVGLGYGFGTGGGSAQPGAGDGGQPDESYGFGTGGGGGGGAMGRPVAVVEIGPNGVRVEPIVDPTKIALAFFTAFGAMFMMFGRMRRQAGG